MNYEALKKILTDVQSNIWVGARVNLVAGVKVWEYEFGGNGFPQVIARGAETNNPDLQFASDEYGVFVDGKKMALNRAQYLDLFGQMGYRFSVVQPMKMQQQSQKR